jgi:hypothetical protein
MTVSGAYGRDYKSLKAAKADWDANKDFRIRDLFSGAGTYINKADAQKLAASTSIMVRYNKDRKIGKLQ